MFCKLSGQEVLSRGTRCDILVDKSGSNAGDRDGSFLPFGVLLALGFLLPGVAIPAIVCLARQTIRLKKRPRRRVMNRNDTRALESYGKRRLKTYGKLDEINKRDTNAPKEEAKIGVIRKLRRLFSKKTEWENKLVRTPEKEVASHNIVELSMVAQKGSDGGIQSRGVASTESRDGPVVTCSKDTLRVVDAANNKALFTEASYQSTDVLFKSLRDRHKFGNINPVDIGNRTGGLEKVSTEVLIGVRSKLEHKQKETAFISQGNSDVCYVNSSTKSKQSQLYSEQIVQQNRLSQSHSSRRILNRCPTTKGIEDNGASGDSIDNTPLKYSVNEKTYSVNNHTLDNETTSAKSETRCSLGSIEVQECTHTENSDYSKSTEIMSKDNLCHGIRGVLTDNTRYINVRTYGMCHISNHSSITTKEIVVPSTPKPLVASTVAKEGTSFFKLPRRNMLDIHSHFKNIHQPKIITNCSEGTNKTDVKEYPELKPLTNMNDGDDHTDNLHTVQDELSTRVDLDSPNFEPTSQDYTLKESKYNICHSNTRLNSGLTPQLEPSSSYTQHPQSNIRLKHRAQIHHGLNVQENSKIMMGYLGQQDPVSYRFISTLTTDDQVVDSDTNKSSKTFPLKSEHFDEKIVPEKLYTGVRNKTETDQYHSENSFRRPSYFQHEECSSTQKSSFSSDEPEPQFPEHHRSDSVSATSQTKRTMTYVPKRSKSMSVASPLVFYEEHDRTDSQLNARNVTASDVNMLVDTTDDNVIGISFKEKHESVDHSSRRDSVPVVKSSYLCSSLSGSMIKKHRNKTSRDSNHKLRSNDGMESNMNKTFKARNISKAKYTKPQRIHDLDECSPFAGCNDIASSSPLDISSKRKTKYRTKANSKKVTTDKQMYNI